jgi:hypothetical protein
MRNHCLRVVVLVSAGGLALGCSKPEAKPEPAKESASVAASAPATAATATPSLATTTEKAAGKKPRKPTGPEFTAVGIAPAGEEERVSACHGEDVHIAVASHVGTNWWVTKYAPLGAPKQEYADGYFGPNTPADKYTFPTKDVPAGTKSTEIVLENKLAKDEKMVVKVDLACAGATAGAAALKLPGACIDPKADAFKRAKTHHTGTSADLEEMVGETHEDLDLDADGTKERVFAVGLGVTDATYLYVMRGKCGHYVGDVGGGGFMLLATHHAGLADLATEDTGHCEGNPAPCEPRKATWRFDGTEYKPVPTK